MKKNKDNYRPVTPGMTRKDEFFIQADGDDVETIIRKSFEALLPMIVKEMKTQNITGMVREFRAFADIHLDTGHTISMEFNGKPPANVQYFRYGKG